VKHIFLSAFCKKERKSTELKVLKIKVAQEFLKKLCALRFSQKSEDISSEQNID
jgi:hypothetical protein